MLVLERKEGESIKLGDDIEITIANISGKRVKIGITAPEELSIERVSKEAEKNNSEKA